MTEYSIKIAQDTAANWTSNNPILLSGELGYETDTGYLKIGDGTTNWVDLDYFSSGFNDPMTTRGDIIYKNSSNTTTRLGVGTNGQVLTSDGTDVSWGNQSSGFEDPMTTRGDIIYKDSDGNTTRLGVGTNGQVLTSDGTDISWENASGSVTSVNGDTGVVVLDADDIDDTSTTNKFVTASDITVLGNTSNTNSGDVTIGTGNGLSIDSQVLSLALADTDTTGALSSTDWDTFNGKQEVLLTRSSTNLLPANTGDDIGSTGTRINKIWATDLEVTNPIDGNINGSSTSVTGLNLNSGTLALVGDDVVTFNTTAATNITFPTTGTLITLAGTETLTNKTLTSPVLTTPQINDASSDHQYIFDVSELTSDRTITLPLLTANDVFVFEDAVQTLTNKTIEIISAPSSDTTIEGITADMTVGETVAFGDLLYMKSDGKLWKSDASDSDKMPVIAMAGKAITADNSGEVLLNGFVRDDSWNWTVGGQVYPSDVTAGDSIQTLPSNSGELVQVIGIATHADRLYFKPDLTLIEVL